jgi:hypothetical protein
LNWFSLVGWVFVLMCALEVVGSAVVIDNPRPPRRSSVMLNAAAQVVLAVWIIIAIGRAGA